ncbi:CoA-transferase [Chloroflexota bacterium]
MKKSAGAIFKSTFKLTRNQGNNKVVSLEEAIRGNVRPGMKLHVREGTGAATREVLRQFWGKAPEFTLITSLLRCHSACLVHGGLVKKLVTTLCSEGAPVFRPSYIVQRAYLEGKMQIECWSLYSFVQRLMAGAFGVCFMPTKSLIGSSVAEENKDSFLVTEDPFGSGRKMGLVKALSPDISLVHGWVTDCYGNTITGPARACGEGTWGPKASAGGVVVTVEKLVSTDFIRRYSSLVSIPGYMVNSVSVCPLGSHPESLINPGLKGFEAYGEDYDFLDEEQAASRNPETMDAWIKGWLLDCPTHDDYLRKLGTERISCIKKRAVKDSWKTRLDLFSNARAAGEANPKETMILVAAHKIREKVIRQGYKIILAGGGTAGLAAWLAYYQLRDGGHDVELLLGSGLLGYAPRPGDPAVISVPTAATCKMITDVVDAYGVFVGSDNNRCLAILGGGEVDKYGNINSTKIPDKVYLTGVGGSNDAINAAESLVVMAQSRGRFLEKVSYTTCPGDRIKTLVSDQGIFEKLGGNEEFTLTGCLPDPKLPDLGDRISRVKDNCGWELEVSYAVEDVPAPASDELAVLRALDPKGYFV